MSAERLLAEFDRVCEVPDAVARLRAFVIELAVRGKLVSQNPGDESAELLLQRTNPNGAGVESARHKGSLEPIRDQSIGLPSSWCWRRLGCVAEYGRPDKVSSNRELTESAWVLDLEDIEKGTSRLIKRVTSAQRVFHSAKTPFCRGDVLFGKLRPYLNKVLVADEDGVCTTEIIPIRCGGAITPEYLALALRSPMTAVRIEKLMYGMKMPRLGTADARMLPIPIPPIAEQVRIVAKVNELIALCDQLEEARVSRETARDKLAKASLARLTGASPKTVSDDSRLVLEALPQLAWRPDQVKELRQTIRNLAVRGMLLKQIPTDEPVQRLLERIAQPAKPARYDKRSPELIKGDCGLSINDPRTPLPDGWLWVPLTRVAKLESGHTPSRSRPDWWGGEVPWIGLVDARAHNDDVIHNTIQTTNEKGLANSAARLLPAGTVCFSRTASVGYVVIMGRSMATSQDFVNWVPSGAIFSRWLQLVLIAERPAIGRFSKGAVHQTIYYPAWLSMHIALPPLEEQRRIVAKVDDLMSLCDQLESALVASQLARERLLESLISSSLRYTHHVAA